MSGAVLYPTAAIRRLVEETAGDESLSATARARELRLLRDDVKVLIGELDARIGEADLLVEAERLASDRAVLRAYENADIREEMIRRGLATPEKLDEAGYISREELDRVLAEHLGLEEARVRDTLGRLWDPIRHPRGRGGRFRDVPDHPDVGKQVKGGKVKRVLKDRKTGKMIPVFQTRSRGLTPEAVAGTGRGSDRFRNPALPEGARQQLRVRRHGTQSPETHPRTADREAYIEREKLSSGSAADIRADNPSREEIRDRAFEQRRRDLEGRSRKQVKKASREDERRGGHAVNFEGHVSQQTFLDWVREVASAPTTAEMHSTTDPVTGKVTWDEDRAEIHERIVDVYLRQRDDDGGFCADCPEYPRHPQGERQVLFMGGGYAAGKGTLQESLAERGDLPRGATMEDMGKKVMVLDPDQIKTLIPEFQETMEGDPEANLLAYEEAWHVAQMVMKAAQARGYDVIVDGISNTSPDEVHERVESFRKAGYTDVKMRYVSIPTDTAAERALSRARGAKKASDKRYIPEPVIRAVHRDVAATLNGMIGDRRFEDVDMQLYDMQERGNPRLAMQKPAGEAEHQVTDERLFDEAMAKAGEEISGLAEDPEHDRYLQNIFSEEEQQASRKRSQPPDWSTREAVEANIPLLQQDFERLMDLGAGIAARLRAKVWGTVGEEHDAEAIAEESGFSVLVAPPKNLNKRALEKVANYKGDWTKLTDLVRGTVIVDAEVDLEDGVDAVRAEIEAQGWELGEVTNRHIRVPNDPTNTGPGPTGYKDLQINAVTPDGRVVEIQVITRAMYRAKEVDGGHGLYEKWRAIAEPIQRGETPMTPEMQTELVQLTSQQRALYERAATEARAVRRRAEPSAG